MPTFPGGYLPYDKNEPFDPAYTGKREPAHKDYPVAKPSERYDPKNPNHYRLVNKDALLGLPVHEVAKIVADLHKYIEQRTKESPGTPGSRAHTAQMQRTQRRIEEAQKSLQGTARKNKIKSLIQEYKAEIKRYDAKTEATVKEFVRKITAWRKNSRNAKILDFLKKLPPNAQFFDENGKPTKNTPLAMRAMLLKHKMIDEGSWSWTKEGERLLKKAGFFNQNFEPERDLEPGLKYGPGIAPPRPSKLKLKNAKKKLERAKTELVVLKQAIKRKLEFMAGKATDPNNEAQVKRTAKMNRIMNNLVEKYNKVRESIDSTHDEVLKAQRELEELGQIAEPIIKDLEEKADAIYKTHRDMSGKYRVWVEDLNLGDVLFKGGRFDGVPLRDVPIDHLLWIEKGAYIDEKTVHKFKKSGKAYEIEMPMKTRKQVPYGQTVRKRIHDYLNTTEGKQRLREHYGENLPDYIYVMEQHAGDLMAEKARKIEKELRKLFPGDKGLELARRHAAESLNAHTKAAQFNLAYQRGLEAGLSPDEASREAQRTMDEASENQEKWRTPTAWEGRGLSDREIAERNRDEMHQEKDKLRRLFHRMSMKQFIRFMWPPESESGKYKSSEYTEVRKKYFSFRAQVLQTNPRDYHTAENEKWRKSKNVPRTRSARAGWLPRKPEWRRMEGENPGPHRALLALLDKIARAKNRSDLLALQERVIELFHQRVPYEIEKRKRFYNEEQGRPYTIEELYALSEQWKEESYWKTFSDDPEAPLARYAHNRIQERLQLFVHPDVTPIDPTEGKTGEEAAAAYEAAAAFQPPYPEVETPEDEAHREEYDRKQEEEAIGEIGLEEREGWNELHIDADKDLPPPVKRVKNPAWDEPFQGYSATEEDIEEYRKKRSVGPINPEEVSYHRRYGPI